MDRSKSRIVPPSALPTIRRGRPCPNPTAPPWEVIQLLSQWLDPKSLAVASCVSKSWYAIFSSEHLWKPICHSLFPSSLHLTTANPSVSHRHLFLLLHAASKRRLAIPSPPLLSLRHLVFMVDVFHGDAPVLSLAVTGEELESLHGIFRFEVRIGEVYKRGEVDAREELRVVWMVVTKECREAFTLIDYVGKGTSVGSNELWFSEKLPCPSSCCCSATMDLADLEAEVVIELCCDHDEAKKRVAKVNDTSSLSLQLSSGPYLDYSDINVASDNNQDLP
ncbi:probable F-box protein At5g04010 [Musa acuminata AAA Group]